MFDGNLNYYNEECLKKVHNRIWHTLFGSEYRKVKEYIENDTKTSSAQCNEIETKIKYD